MDKEKNFCLKNNIEFYEDFDSSLVSSIRLGATIKLAVFPKNKRELILILKFLFASKIAYRVCGNSSNILFVEKINYVVVFTSKMVDEIDYKNKMVTVSAGMLLPRMCESLKKNKLSGYEGLINIPATVGGAIMSNAGAFGYSISDRLVEIEVFSNGRVFSIKKNEIHFGYHYSNLFGLIVISATFLFENKNEYDIIKLCNEFTYKRGRSQPNGLSLGSVFKKVNNRSAGFYLERAGLKNFRIGGLVVSNKHANFFVNDKSGSVMDFLRLLVESQLQVEKQFGVTLVPEIEKVGDNHETFSRFSYPFKK